MHSPFLLRNQLVYHMIKTSPTVRKITIRLYRTNQEA